MEIIDKKPITLTEVKEILTNKDDAGLSEEVLKIFNKTLRYVTKFSKLSLKDAIELKEKIKNLNLNLSEEDIIKIVNILPKNPDEFRMLLSKENKFQYTEEEIKKLLDCVVQYV